MLAVYLGCFVFGGVLVGASVFTGADSDADADAGADADGDGHHGGVKLPILSLRFWTFALTAFGLTGALLTLVGAGAVLTPALAGAMGLGGGAAAQRLLGRLARETVGQLRGADSHIGREGRLLLPVAKGQRGKLRLEIGGVTSDFLAETDADQTLPAGSAVIVVGLRGNVALVERSPALPPLPAPSDSEKKEPP
jgi:membrane protein implicated in regulation of membrane protease activity